MSKDVAYNPDDLVSLLQVLNLMQPELRTFYRFKVLDCIKPSLVDWRTLKNLDYQIKLIVEVQEIIEKKK